MLLNIILCADDGSFLLSTLVTFAGMNEVIACFSFFRFMQIVYHTLCIQVLGGRDEFTLSEYPRKRRLQSGRSVSRNKDSSDGVFLAWFVFQVVPPRCNYDSLVTSFSPPNTQIGDVLCGRYQPFLCTQGR